MGVVLAEPAGMVALSQLGVLLQIAATKGSQASESERHAAHAAAMALREVAADQRGLDRLLGPVQPEAGTGRVRRFAGLGAAMLEGLAVLLQEGEIAVVTDAAATWSYLAQSRHLATSLALMSDRRFRGLIVGLLGAMHIKGTEAIAFAGQAMCSLVRSEAVCIRMMQMQTLDSLLVQEACALLRIPEAVRLASAMMCAVAAHAPSRMHLLADNSNFELLLHQLVVMMHEASMPFSAAVLAAFAADLESRRLLLMMPPLRSLVGDLAHLVNPQKSLLPGPACAVLAQLTQDWSSQARLISLHPDPFLLCAAVMFQVHYQQKATEDGASVGEDDVARAMSVLPNEVWLDPEMKELVLETRRDAAYVLRNLLGHPDNVSFVMGRGTGIRQWPDLLHGAAALLSNHQRVKGNLITIDPLPQAAAECLTAISVAAGVRVLAQEETLVCETLELLLWITEWPIDAFKHKAMNAIFCIAGGMEDIPEEWGLRFMALLPPFLIEAMFRILCSALHPADPLQAALSPDPKLSIAGVEGCPHWITARLSLKACLFTLQICFV